jgi:hypothetical protein
MADMPKQQGWDVLSPQRKMGVADAHRAKTDRNICKKTGKKLTPSKNKHLLSHDQWNELDGMELYFYSEHPVGELEWKFEWVRYTDYIYRQFEPKVANKLIDNESICCLEYPLLEHHKLTFKDKYEEYIHEKNIVLKQQETEIKRLKRNVINERQSHRYALKMIKYIVRDNDMLINIIDEFINSVRFDNGYCNGSIRTANLHCEDLNKSYWSGKEDK